MSDLEFAKKKLFVQKKNIRSSRQDSKVMEETGEKSDSEKKEMIIVQTFNNFQSSIKNKFIYNRTDLTDESSLENNVLYGKKIDEEVRDRSKSGYKCSDEEVFGKKHRHVYEFLRNAIKRFDPEVKMDSFEQIKESDEIDNKKNSYGTGF
mmetsp:Transcript_7749/g.7206  ORF Transcript_7749/g.7206 Transcript_7749/m.7206 type:complete len:150 (-) Transcript_7749:2198-2647(-)